MTIEIAYVVDDDPSICEALSELLASEDIKNVTFATASAYLQHTRHDAAACLILDLNLPDICGLDLQRRIASPTCLPIIFISGGSDVASSVQAMKAGAVDFLTKPLDKDALVAAIRAAFLQDRFQRRIAAERASLRERFSTLTPREREVFPLVTKGVLNKQAAGLLGISEVTLQVHRGQIMRKMKADSFAELVRMAVKLRAQQHGDAS
jgi:FixJ family two-component response regulator